MLAFLLAGCGGGPSGETLAKAAQKTGRLADFAAPTIPDSHRCIRTMLVAAAKCALYKSSFQ